MPEKWFRVLVFLLAACAAAQTVPSQARRAIEARGGSALVVSLPDKKQVATAGAPALLNEAHSTGSAIKPLTALLALESGALKRDTAILCRRETSAGGQRLRCSHPTVMVPLSVTDALAVSCNFFFAEVGRRLGTDALVRGFRKSGFDAQPADPALLATGHSAVRATLRQLLQFQLAMSAGTLPFKAEHMALVRQGLEKAVRDGTAGPAAIAGASVAGKTGTALREGAPFRRSGWFAGWAPADSPRFAVVVWLRQGEGSDAAALAGQLLRPLLTGAPFPAATTPGERLRVELFTSAPVRSLRIVPARGNAIEWRAGQVPRAVQFDCGTAGCLVEAAAPGVSPRRLQGIVEVGDSGNALRVIHLVGVEDYIAGVIAGEAGELKHPEALKAMAVAARSFAERNRPRHTAEGFHFCSLTHCQVYTVQSPGDAFRAAAVATQGQVLKFRGEVIQAYYSGSCGGHTEAARNVWPEGAEPYLLSRPDPYCVRDPNAWTTRIPAPQLENALQADRSANPGGRIREFGIVSRDDSGRVRQLRINTRLVNGNYFRFLIGRRLGWEKLKSTWFDVHRDGGDFVFRGRGFGHGVGLCQTGAAFMAQAGHDYREILAQYFPGTDLSGAPATKAAKKPQAAADNVEALLDAARTRLAARGIPAVADVRVVAHPSTEAFIKATGKPGWAAASSDRRTLHLQPPSILRARGTLQQAVTHEYVHIALWDTTDARIPVWLREGVALYFAAEQPVAGGTAGPAPPLEQSITRPRSQDEMRRAYARALEQTRILAREAGEAGLLRMLRQPSAQELQRLNAIGRQPL